MSINQVDSGVTGLNDILCGGIPRHSAVIVEGGPGSGKTILGLQYVLHGAQQGDPGLYITFEELPEQLSRATPQFSWRIKELQERNLLQIISMDYEVFYRDILEVDGVFEKLISQIQCKRLVIDSISLFKYLAIDERDYRTILYTLHNILRKKGVTSLLLSEQTNTSAQHPVEHYVFDGLICLYFHKNDDGSRSRSLEVMKMRGTSIIEGEQPFIFTQDGISLVGTVRNEKISETGEDTHE